MKNVLIVNDEMVFGGVAKVLVNMLKVLDLKDCKIDILILHPHGEMLKDIPEKYEVIPSSPFFEVCDISLSNALKSGSPSVIFNKIKLYLLMKTGRITKVIQRERKKILKKQYDVEIAYKEGFCTIFTAAGDSKKKVNWVHADYRLNNTSKHHMPLVIDALSRIDVNVAQSEDAAEAYKEVFGLKEMTVIRNFIDTEEIRQKSLAPCELKKDTFNMVGIGRMHYQKGFVRMMDVLHNLKEKGHDFCFTLVGDGEERAQIEEKIREYALEDCVHLAGYDNNPYRYIRAADLVVLPSYSESSPTIVYETLAVGTTPVVACEVAGLRSQLEDGRFGIICYNSVQGLTDALDEVLRDPKILEKYRAEMKLYENTNNIESAKKVKELLENEETD